MIWAADAVIVKQTLLIPKAHSTVRIASTEETMALRMVPTAVSERMKKKRATMVWAMVSARKELKAKDPGCRPSVAQK